MAGRMQAAGRPRGAPRWAVRGNETFSSRFRSLLSLPERPDRSPELAPLDPIMGGSTRPVSYTATVSFKSRVSAIFTVLDQRT